MNLYLYIFNTMLYSARLPPYTAVSRSVAAVVDCRKRRRLSWVGDMEGS